MGLASHGSISYGLFTAFIRNYANVKLPFLAACEHRLYTGSTCREIVLHTGSKGEGVDVTDTVSPQGSVAGYRLIRRDTGGVFRVGETPRKLPGIPRGVVFMAGWGVMCLCGLVEYTWGALSGSLQAAHHWGTAPVFWLFSFFVTFESFVQIGPGLLRNKGYLPVRWAVIAGGVICGILGYALTAYSTSIWGAYLGYAVLGGIGSGMCYSSAINIVAKWYPEKKGWRTGFVNGGWAYGSVPFILVIGGFATGSGVGVMSPNATRNFILLQGLIMTVGIFLAGLFMKDPPKNWWPACGKPLDWAKKKRPRRHPR